MQILWDGNDMWAVAKNVEPATAWPVIARHDEVMRAVREKRVLVPGVGPRFLGEPVTDEDFIASLTVERA